MNRRWIKQSQGEVVEEGMYDVTWKQVRAERDQALKDSDWRAGKDVVLSTAWKEYRQALRDLGGFDDANSAADSWPVAPDE
jgi:hypothetical protein